MANGRSLMVLVLAASACDAPAPRVAASPAPITSASSPPARAPAGVPPSPAETAYEALPSECRGDIVKTLTSPSCRVSSPDARADSKGRLELFVSPPMLVVERGEVLHARVRLHNVGATPIVLLLRPDAPWGHAPDRVSSRYVVGTVTDANGLDPSTHEPRIALIQRMDGPLTDAVREPDERSSFVVRMGLGADQSAELPVSVEQPPGSYPPGHYVLHVDVPLIDERRGVDVPLVVTAARTVSVEAVTFAEDVPKPLRERDVRDVLARAHVEREIDECLSNVKLSVALDPATRGELRLAVGHDGKVLNHEAHVTLGASRAPCTLSVAKTGTFAPAPRGGFYDIVIRFRYEPSP